MRFDANAAHLHCFARRSDTKSLDGSRWLIILGTVRLGVSLKMEMHERSLERLFINNADFDQLSEAMDVFCPFDAVGMENQEIRHGFFLRYILDPARPHGFGAECLRAFMWAAAEALQASEALQGETSSRLSALDVHLMNLDDVNVTREYKSIDLLIEIPRERVIVAVELKIDAGEHSGQLGRYRRIIKEEYSNEGENSWRQLFLFLTKRGEMPSEEDGEEWQAFPLESVADALHRLIERGVGQPDARMMLAAYVAMLRRRHLSDQRIEDIARKLWREHGEALEFLMSRKPDTLSDVYQAITAKRQSIASRLSKLIDGTIEPDHSNKNEIRFAVKEWDDIPGMLEGNGWKPSRRIILLLIKRDAKNNTRIVFYLGRGPQEIRQAIFDAIKSGGIPIEGTWGIEKYWRQLTYKDIPAPADDESPEAYEVKILSELGNFILDNFAAYDKALRSLILA